MSSPMPRSKDALIDEIRAKGGCMPRAIYRLWSVEELQVAVRELRAVESSQLPPVVA